MDCAAKATFISKIHVGAAIKGCKTSATSVVLVGWSLCNELHWDTCNTRGIVKTWFDTSLPRRVMDIGETFILFINGDNDTCITEKRRNVWCLGTPILYASKYKAMCDNSKKGH